MDAVTYPCPSINDYLSTHLPLDKKVSVPQTIFSDAFSWKKCFIVWLNFHWRLFLGSPIDNSPSLVQIIAWRRIGANHYLNQCWPGLLTHICGTRGRWVKEATTINGITVHMHQAFDIHSGNFALFIVIFRWTISNDRLSNVYFVFWFVIRQTSILYFL